ncbi:MAG: GNAT family N-acetyltransferase [Blastocatellia bacterium]
MSTEQPLNTDSAAHQIRPCRTLDEFRACIDMQRDIWRFSDLDVVPLRAFVITRHSGGFTLGAFAPDNQLLGFAHALAAFEDGARPYYYSHMLAVREDLQNAGLGVKLKLAQRDHALAEGIPVIRWTFDPLQSRNAYLNIVKLGGVVRKYLVNYYGDASSSVLHAGLETDRLFAEWWVGSDRVARAIQGARAADPAPARVVEVPWDIQVIKDKDMNEARRWQMQIREQFQQCLADGLYCAGFARGENGDPSRYLFYPDTRAEVAPGY